MIKATLVLLFGVTHARDPAREAMVNEINTMPGVLWLAGFNKNFEELPVGASDTLCGVLPNSEEELLANAALPPSDFAAAAAIPTDFDSVQNWPQCASVIGDIRDQDNCGCCTAFGAASAASDRICIFTNGSKQLHIPAEAGCNDCAGGTLYTSWSHFLHPGAVTGSRWFRPKYRHLRKWGFSGSVTAYRSVADIQTAIMTHGPVEAALTVHADFENYESGIYHHVTGRALGRHAIRLVGWGTMSGTDYWKVANSWSADWGEQGYFRIMRGNNEVGIESQVIANGPNDRWSLD